MIHKNLTDKKKQENMDKLQKSMTTRKNFFEEKQ